eukprot:TRINITY_DN1941_c2_g2_i1.p1 TRINITY_DN1941_c2_g2~~TRINITY_DN1941_c2_g2_i1.p1  ORF type:complete len:364 (-),score=7.94 TRINITY_DN1941_c2_g2_i1:137-1228(-)
MPRRCCTEQRPADGRQRELGFTFSFPCDQTAINGGKLIRWTKGFNIPDTEGRDVVRVLEEALERQGLSMRVTALVNDAVGTLAGARYLESDVAVAVILGTGTNACYEEMTERSWRVQGDVSPRMVINMEWGNFWSPHLPITPYDDRLDSNSHNCGDQRYEKITSGMYMGEIVRLVLLDAALRAELFGGAVPRALKEPYALPTPKVAVIHSDTSADLADVGSVLADVLQFPHSSLAQRRQVQQVCSIIGTRGARLVAAGLVGVLQKLGRDGGEGGDVGNARSSNGSSSSNPQQSPQPPLGHTPHTVVAVDGGLYEHYAPFREALHETLKEVLGDDVAGFVSMRLSKDGSGIGAALLAASHSLYK